MVCAVVGGVIANEIIKIISGKERPINNAFLFDALSGEGVVQRLGPCFDCPWGIDKGEFKKETKTNMPGASDDEE